MFYLFLLTKSSWLNIWKTSVVLIFLLISWYLKFLSGASSTISKRSMEIKNSGSLISLDISYSLISFAEFIVCKLDCIPFSLLLDRPNDCWWLNYFLFMPLEDGEFKSNFFPSEPIFHFWLPFLWIDYLSRLNKFKKV